MDKPSGLVGELIEKGQKSASLAASDVTQTVQDQVGLKNEASSQSPQVQNQTQQPQETPRAFDEDNERTKEVVQDFYAPSDDTQNRVGDPNALDQQKLAQVRQQLYQELHNEVYYNPLFAYESKQQVERPAEVAEQKEQQKMQELEIKQVKKSQDLAVLRKQTTVEANRGTVG